DGKPGPRRARAERRGFVRLGRARPGTISVAELRAQSRAQLHGRPRSEAPEALAHPEHVRVRAPLRGRDHLGGRPWGAKRSPRAGTATLVRRTRLGSTTWGSMSHFGCT